MPDPAISAHVHAEETPEGLLLRDALGDVRPRLISREPLGAGTVAGFAIGEDHADQTYFVDTSRLGVVAETGLAMGHDQERPEARIWLHPADPHLPALAATAFPHSVGILLRRLGIGAEGTAQMVGYRPGRRAVLRVPAEAGDIWIKVVRPSRIDRIIRAHRACAEAGLPVPALRGWSPEGLLVLDPAVGTPASDVAWRPAELLTVTEQLRERIAAVPWEAPARSIASRLDWYAARIGGWQAAVRVAERTATRLRRLAPQPLVTVHGDLHYGQLFLTDGAITGFIDVDTLGAGVRAEDSAAFLSHAVASARLTPASAAGRVWELADGALHRWGDDPAVRPYTALHLIGHALAVRDLRDESGARQLIDAAQRIVEGGPAAPAEV